MQEKADSKTYQKSIDLAVDILKDAVKLLKNGKREDAIKLLRERADWIETITDPNFAKKAQQELDAMSRGE